MRNHMVNKYREIRESPFMKELKKKKKKKNNEDVETSKDTR